MLTSNHTDSCRLLDEQGIEPGKDGKFWRDKYARWNSISSLRKELALLSSRARELDARYTKIFMRSHEEFGDAVKTVVEREKRNLGFEHIRKRNEEMSKELYRLRSENEGLRRKLDDLEGELDERIMFRPTVNALVELVGRSAKAVREEYSHAARAYSFGKRMGDFGPYFPFFFMGTVKR